MFIMKKIPVLVFTLIALVGAWADSSELRSIETLTSHLTAEEKNELFRKKNLFRSTELRHGLFYLPQVPLGDRIKKRYDQNNPDVGVEAFFITPYPEGMSNIERELELYNIVRQVSKISGVQYWSENKERYRVLFDDVYMIDEKKRAIADNPVQTIPDYDSFEIHMDEANLGSDYYLAEYQYDGSHISFSLTNTSTMRFIFNVVGEEGMQIDLLLMPLENEILIYGYCGVMLANPAFVNRIMDPVSSFFRRLYAMEIWFTNSLHNVNELPDKDILDRKRQ